MTQKTTSVLLGFITGIIITSMVAFKAYQGLNVNNIVDTRSYSVVQPFGGEPVSANVTIDFSDNDLMFIHLHHQDGTVMTTVNTMGNLEGVWARS